MPHSSVLVHSRRNRKIATTQRRRSISVVAMVSMLLLSLQRHTAAAYSVRRQLGSAAAVRGLDRVVDFGTFQGGPSRSSLHDIACARTRSFSLNAARKNDRDRFYSVDDLNSRDPNERSMPPIMDSATEDEGYGAYDYQPDVYDLEAMNKEQENIPDDFFDGPPPVVVQKAAVMPNKKQAPAGRTSPAPAPTMEQEALMDAFFGDSVAVPKAKAKKKVVAPKAAASPVPAPKAAAVPVPSPIPTARPGPFSIMEDIVEEVVEEDLPLPPAPAPVPAPVARPAPFSIMESPDVITQEEPPTTKRAPDPVPVPAPAPFGPPRPSAFPPRSEMMKTTTHFHAARVAQGPMDGYLEKAAYGSGATSGVDGLKREMEDMAQQIYQKNKGKEFNINSPKQVSQVLFGFPGETTNKETLEGMAAGANGSMADLILQHRALKASIKRMERKQTNKDNNTHVTSAATVARADTTTPEDADPVILVDASAYIFRAYYSMPPIHRGDGMPTGAVMGFCNMLNRLILNRMLAGERPRLILVFDVKGKNFRHDLYSEYKSHRPDAPVDLIPQFDLIREAATAYGIPQLEAPNYEADDVIATLATMALEEGVDTNILSGDKDLMQLITPKDEVPSVHMIDPMTMSRVTYDQVMEKWGVGPELLGDVLALAGDSADNVPGVPGIGPKIAASLIGEFGTLEGLLGQVDSVKQKGRRAKLQDNMEQARLSRILVELERQVPMDVMSFPNGKDGKVADLRMEPINSDRMLAFYDLMGFRDLKRRLQDRLQGGGGGGGRGPPPGQRPAYKNKRAKTEVPKPEDYSDVPF